MSSMIPPEKSTLGSHPLIRFEPLPMLEGPLTQFDHIRSSVLREVLSKTLSDFSGQEVETVIGEALYSERQRLRRVNKVSASHLFTFPRYYRDKDLWRQIHRGMLKSATESSRTKLLQRSAWHYADEIGGHFKPGVYRFATHAVPWSVSWLLNAASVRRFLPWGMTQSLENSLLIQGEIPMLQKLSKKGTILLVPTHQSNLDSVVIGYVIYLMGLPPFAYGAGLNLFSNPVLSFFMSSLGAYTVDRQKNNDLYKAVLKNYSTVILRRGVHSIFFPGGGRSRTGALETRLKLGLLGTGLAAQIDNMKEGKPNSNVYVVPMVMSYHFVPEALSLIEQYLSQVGGFRFMGADTEESPRIVNIIKFFWKLFSSKGDITVRVGRAMDVFGNEVDDEGNSIGPNGTYIDPKKWLTTLGSVQHESQRDHEYTRQLGNRVVDSYYKNNVVLSSHVVAFTFFSALRRRYPDLDLYRLLRLTSSQRSIPYDQYLSEAADFHRRLRDGADRGQYFLEANLLTHDVRSWVEKGVQKLGSLHDLAAVKIKNNFITTEDMNLLYFYRNRLSGYGFSLLANQGLPKVGRGENDEKGFLV